MNTIVINSSHHKTEMCTLGEDVSTDKSPFCPRGHRHTYTAIYNLLFAQLKNKKIKLAEIGIQDGNSLKLWSRYFTNCKIYGFDYDYKWINICNSLNLENIILNHIDVTNKKSINDAFQQTESQFDIIIDDSSHVFEDEIRIIQNITNFLKPGGILIIEDIYESWDNNIFIEAIGDNIIKEYSFYTFILGDHYNKYTDGLDNNKLLIMIKK